MGNLQRRDQALKVAGGFKHCQHADPYGQPEHGYCSFSFRGFNLVTSSLGEHFVRSNLNHLISHIRDSDHTENLMTLIQILRGGEILLYSIIRAVSGKTLSYYYLMWYIKISGF